MNKYGVILFPKVTVTKILEREEEIELIRKAQEGNEDAFSALYEAHRNLIITEAKRFKNSGLDIEDRIAEGNSGLLKGIRRYNPEKGTRLATYAIWWMRHYIYKAVTDQRMPRIPPEIWKKIVKVLKTEENLLKLGKEPTIEEISKETNLSSEKIKRLYAYLKEQRIISLDWTLRESETTIEEVLDLGENEETLIFSQIFTEEAEEKINKLSVREKYKIIFRLRLGLMELEEAKEEIDKLPVSENLKRTFKKRIDLLIESNSLVGLNGKRRYTLEEIGEIFDITRERVRQIEGKVGKELGKVVLK